MRKCPDCPKTTKKHGEPTLSGRLLDQIIVCPNCGWCGVHTEVLIKEAAMEFKAELKQLPLFEGPI